MHVDQARASSVQEKIDGFRFGDASIAGKRQGVGAVDADLVAGANQRFELRDDQLPMAVAYQLRQDRAISGRACRCSASGVGWRFRISCPHCIKRPTGHRRIECTR